MTKLLLTCVVTFVGFTTQSYADVNDKMKDSQYCMDNSYDVICMGPEMTATRTKMMEMNKEKAMENRSKYCRDHADAKDPICDPKMMNDATGY